jgi:type I restriction enzyme R subunit
MDTPSFKEDHISQIPAIQLLVNLGYQYLPPAEALQLRGGKESAVLLEPVLLEQLGLLNEINYKGQVHAFNEQNLASCVRALKDAPLNEGLITANEKIYDLLTLGTTREQRVNGDKKSFSLRFIDWEQPERNVFHVTEELSVLRTNGRSHYRPDLVLYVNGIPFVVIECKRPDSKKPLAAAISQQLRNQQPGGIMPLYVYNQLTLALATTLASYATVGAEPEFWSTWREGVQDNKEILRAINRPLDADTKDELFGDRFRYVRAHFDELERKGRLITEQDRYLYHLCRPERLLDLTRNFVVYDNGVKKIARYQQYFAIKKTMSRIRVRDGGRRRGGVIWHTQGSGKSLTMVMLANAIAEDPTIRNPKIVIVTDRVSLDDQIYKTFQKCDVAVHQAATGTNLIELLESKSDAIVTTVINKFEAAVRRRSSNPFTSEDIFVLIDEGHRTQYGTFNVAMRRVFPHACFLAFTGTPLKQKEKQTASKFGGIIDSYTVKQAVADGAVVPLYYEGRLAELEVASRPLNAKFERLTENLSSQQVNDFKQKYARAEHVDKAQQVIDTVARDISDHYVNNWRGTGFKAQLVTRDKRTAVKYYNAIGAIPDGATCSLIISAPDMREGEDDAFDEADNLVKKFWNKMMAEHTTPERYATNLIGRFKTNEAPEIIIVVDKLLTGFDAPFNRTLYLTRALRGHTLLQAIARVNRLAPGKDYGLIIDYAGVLEELHDALKEFGTDYDPDELEGTVINVSEAVTGIPQKHSELWAIFAGIASKTDLQAYQEVLADDPTRDLFYDLLSQYARLLKLGLSSVDWTEATGEEQVKKYKHDLGFFAKLRAAARNIYSDAVDYGEYEKQIQKLIDQHVTSYQVEQITEQVNIFEVDAFAAEVEKIVGLGSKADLIASRTARHLNERMDDDKTMYQRFSKMLKDIIEDYRQRRITEAEYFARVKDLSNNVISGTDSTVPAPLRNHPEAQAFYGATLTVFEAGHPRELRSAELAVAAGLRIDEIVRSIVLDNGKPVVDWVKKDKLTGPLAQAIEDYLFDTIGGENGLPLSEDDVDDLVAAYLLIAKRRYA